MRSASKLADLREDRTAAGEKAELELGAPGGQVASVLLRFLFMALAPICVRAETAALWLFDEPVGSKPGAMLQDAAGHGHLLTLGSGAAILPGKFGHALRIIASQPRAQEELAPGAFIGGKARPVSVVRMNPSDSPLNLGAADWTIECWLRLNAAASDEGTLFELGIGPRAASELVTRFSVVPREESFVFASISTEADHHRGPGARRVEFPNPEGPPAGVAFVHSTTLALNGSELPRETWFHLALVHSGESRIVRLYVDGRQRAAATVAMSALPRSDDAYLTLGTDGRGERPLSGALDEVRISTHAVYHDDFTPPGSIARLPEPPTSQPR